jgi:hypothetical protein
MNNKGERPLTFPLLRSESCKWFSLPSLLSSQILHVHICAEPHVVRKIPADVIGVFVDHNLVGVPQPAVAKSYVSRGYISIPPVEPEAPRAAAAKMPHVPAAKPAGEPAMRKRLVQMIARIVWACIVAYPCLPVHMGCVRVAGLVAEVTVWFDRVRRAMKGRGASRRGRSMCTSLVLRERWNR